jgi:hypothetical protein
MNRRSATRITLVTLGLALAACVVNLSFTMDKPSVQLKSTAGQTSIQQQAIPVTLSDYKEITDHKDNIKSFDLDYVDITITAVASDNTANTVTGSVALRKVLTDPAANDISVGAITNLQLAVGKTVRISGTPALDAFLLQQLQTAGSFYVLINGSIDTGVADVTVDVNQHVSIGYDAGLF